MPWDATFPVPAPIPGNDATPKVSTPTNLTQTHYRNRMAQRCGVGQKADKVWPST